MTELTAAAGPLLAMTRALTERLRVAGAQGALSPFGFRAKAEKDLIPDALSALLQAGDVRQMSAGAKPRYVWADAEVSPADALKALAAAKAKGMTLDALAKKLKVMASHLEPCLAGLAAQNQAVAARKGKTLSWFTAAWRPPTLDDVTAKLTTLLRGPALFDDADAKNTLTTRERPLLKQSLAWLAMEAQIRPLTHTKRRVGGKPGASRALWQWITPDAQPDAQPTPSPATTDATDTTTTTTATTTTTTTDAAASYASSAAPNAPEVGDAMRAAYASLRAEGGAPFALIHALHARSGLPLAAAQSWLLSEARAGRAQLTGSNLAALPDDARAAAVTWGGEPCALARLTPGAPLEPLR